MKKVFVFLVVGYLVVGGILLLLDEPSAPSVRILSIETPSAFLITDDTERFAFSLFLDDPDAFLTVMANVTRASIHDAEETLALLLVEIVRTGAIRSDDGIRYDEFRYVFTTDGVSIDVGTLTLEDAVLSFDYEGGTTGDYRVGDVDFVFGAPGDPRHFDFTRLYAVYEDVDGRDALAGIVIGLETKTGTPIHILDVDLHIADVIVSLGEALELDELPAADASAATLLGDPLRTLLDPPVGGTLSFVTGRYFLPVVHEGRIRPVARFPIDIRYEYDGREYRFLIDDFAFRSAFADPASYGETIHRYEHLR
ncbi:MAG TPA: hypothetical protein DCR44_00455 [Acholeplasmatales bacterium]|nr:hypothetical protein [Acholeplasmatales bacterium]